MDLIDLKELFLVKLRKGRSHGSSYTIAKETVIFMRKLVATARYNTIDELLNLLKSEGKSVANAAPTEFIVRNMMLRVLKLIREERARQVKGTDEVADPHDALNKLWKEPEQLDKEIGAKQLRDAVIATITEFLDELENSRDNISAQAIDHVKVEGDTIVTYGYSTTVDTFLKAALTSGRQFNLVIVEKSRNERHILQDEPQMLSDRLRVVDATDMLSSMRSATKVIIGGAAILADGGCIALSGTQMLAVIAKRHSVPVIVCAAFYKLTPKFLTMNDVECGSEMCPSDVVPFSQAGHYAACCDIINPLFDYIPPELITLYVPQTFGIAPSHVYRLLGEYYHPDDIDRNL